MKLQRSHIVIGILLVAVLALLIFTIQQSTGGGVAPTPPRTTLSGTVYSVQQNSNFSLVLFEDMKTRVTYATIVLNSTGSPSTCSTQPCTYSRISLYSNEPYNVTIVELVTTHVQGGAVISPPYYCQATPFPYTPTASTETQSFTCNATFPK